MEWCGFERMNDVARSKEDVLDKLFIMRKQETTTYAYRNCFPKDLQAEPEVYLNLTWREKICQWSYNVVDQ
jgi:hypothetical protein